VENIINPGLDTAQEGLIEVFEEMDGQLDKEKERLEELRRLREVDPGQWTRQPKSQHGFPCCSIR